jgi:hypothetical protein
MRLWTHYVFSFFKYNIAQPLLLHEDVGCSHNHCNLSWVLILPWKGPSSHTFWYPGHALMPCKALSLTCKYWYVPVTSSYLTSIIKKLIERIELLLCRIKYFSLWVLFSSIPVENSWVATKNITPFLTELLRIFKEAPVSLSVDW